MITDPSRMYLVVGGGDGYETRVVAGSDLEDAFLAMLFGDASNCPESERGDMLAGLRDEDGHWEHNYHYGPVRYGEDFEDGYISVILMTQGAEVGLVAGCAK